MSKKTIVIDARYCDIAEKKWGSRYKIVPSFRIESLSTTPVCAHPDLSLCKIGNTYVAEKTAYPYYKSVLGNVDLREGETRISMHYPQDIAYNVLIFERIAYASFSYTDSVVKQVLNAQNFLKISIRQGYARCSGAVVGNRGIITSDPSLANACKKQKIDVLGITPGGVALPGYAYGFIGGASGFVDDTLLFFGDITKHKNHDTICEFLKQRKVEMDYIENFPLTDVGTIIGIDEE